MGHIRYSDWEVDRQISCYHAPFDDDVIADDQEVLEYVRACKLCATGMKFVMGIRAWHFRTIRRAVRYTSIMPAHKGKGKVSNNGIKCDDLWMQALTHHYEYLLNLGEVRATRVVATLVDGVQGHANRDKGTVNCDEVTVDMIHLPMTMGYRNCYKCYMASLDYNVSSTAQGGLIVTGVGGKAVDSGPRKRRDIKHCQCFVER